MDGSMDRRDNEGTLIEEKRCSRREESLVLVAVSIYPYGTLSRCDVIGRRQRHLSLPSFFSHIVSGWRG